MLNFLRPKYFVIGIFVGFVLCCFIGYTISKKARFQHFTRFILPIQPQTQYYPISHELLETAKHDVHRDKILVVVGGSSIFRGTGQNPHELWTLELQRLLGDKFKVINYAIDQASFTSFGAVAFRILREHYPKIIFTSTCQQTGSGPLDGIDIYNYFFWDAYYKKLFHPEKFEAEKISKIRKDQIMTPKGLEQHILSYLDSFFYFRNLWNWLGYHLGNTVWSDALARKPFHARHHYEDLDNPYLKNQVEETTRDMSRFKIITKRETDMVNGMVDLANKKLKMSNNVLSMLRQNYDDAFPKPYRSNILCVITTENPHMLSALPIKTQQGYWAIINQFRSLLENLGYYALDVGKDFSSTDYADEGHFLATGGKKIAEQVANKIKYIAFAKGYYLNEKQNGEALK